MSILLAIVVLVLSITLVYLFLGEDVRKDSTPGEGDSFGNDN